MRGNPICVPPGDHPDLISEELFNEGDVTEVYTYDVSTGALTKKNRVVWHKSAIYVEPILENDLDWEDFVEDSDAKIYRKVSQGRKHVP
jgi:hypothetical protein